MSGSKSRQLNKLGREMHYWCTEKNIWLSSVHIAGKINTSADNRFDKHVNFVISNSSTPEPVVTTCAVRGCVFAAVKNSSHVFSTTKKYWYFMSMSRLEIEFQLICFLMPVA